MLTQTGYSVARQELSPSRLSYVSLFDLVVEF